MNNLWVFGCSFSVGQNMIPKKDWDYQVAKRYSRLLSKELDYNQKNLAECGASNFYIYRNVLKYLKDIKTNDILIIQWTSPYRFELSTRVDDVYFSLPYLDFTMPELGTTDGSEINPLIKEYKKLSNNFIAQSYNEKWLLESSYNLQFTLYHTLENLKVKHIHLYGWPTVVTDLVELDKFLDRSFIDRIPVGPEMPKLEPADGPTKLADVLMTRDSLKHPNVEENFNLKERLMNKILDLNYLEQHNG
jgi:hypothetical protein